MDLLSGPIPTILSASITTLKTAYGVYEGVTVRRKQIGLLLDRCRDLVRKVAEQLAVPGERSPAMNRGIDSLHKTCEDVLNLLTTLKSKPFLWCIMNTDEIDDGIKAVQDKLTESFRIFAFTSQLESDRFQQDMKLARREDSQVLKQLAANDDRMLLMLQEQGVSLRKIESALASSAATDNSENSTSRVFLQTARSVLRRTTLDATSETGASTSPSGLETAWSSALRSHPIWWKRGDSSMHIDRLIIPKPPNDRQYQYRVLKDETDLGIRPTYTLDADGSQVVNLLEYNQGYGIHDSRRVRVYVGEEGRDGRELLIADRTPDEPDTSRHTRTTD